jgi:hypothetical protein
MSIWPTGEKVPLLQLPGLQSPVEKSLLFQIERSNAEVSMEQKRGAVSCQLTPGTRVRLCVPFLQAFYGLYGTVRRLRPRADGSVILVDVQMDDIPVHEGDCMFAVDQLAVFDAE